MTSPLNSYQLRDVARWRAEGRRLLLRARSLGAARRSARRCLDRARFCYSGAARIVVVVTRDQAKRLAEYKGLAWNDQQRCSGLRRVRVGT